MESIELSDMEGSIPLIDAHNASENASTDFSVPLRNPTEDLEHGPSSDPGKRMPSPKDVIADCPQASTHHRVPAVVPGSSHRTCGTWTLTAQLTFVVSLSILLLLAILIPALRSTPSMPSARLGFQHGIERRSTMDIIYSCLATMVICSVSAVHLDLPTNTSHRLAFNEKIRSKDFWEEITRKILWWTVGLLAPEIVVGCACADYYDALKDCSVMKTKCAGWTLKHSFFAGMGGFAFEDGAKLRSGRGLLRQGVLLTKETCERIEYEISDKSKADNLTNTLAVVQITRFLMGTIARAANSLPVSPLEYFTCAQVFSALLCYVFWFDKPRGVQEKIPLESGDQAEVEEQEHSERELLFLSGDSHSHVPVVSATAFAAILVGASTLASWNEQFPSTAERVIWKVFSLTSVIVPFITIPWPFIFWEYFRPLLGRSNADERKPSRRFFPAVMRFFSAVMRFFLLAATGFLLTIVCIVLCLTRTVIVFLVFYSFRSLPSGVYDTQSWLDLLPFFH